MSNRIYRKVELYSTKPHEVSEGGEGKRVREEANKGNIRKDKSELCTVGPKGVRRRSDVGGVRRPSGGRRKESEGGLRGSPLIFTPLSRTRRLDESNATRVRGPLLRMGCSQR